MLASIFKYIENGQRPIRLRISSSSLIEIKPENTLHFRTRCIFGLDCDQVRTLNFWNWLESSPNVQSVFGLYVTLIRKSKAYNSILLVLFKIIVMPRNIHITKPLKKISSLNFVIFKINICMNKYFKKLSYHSTLNNSKIHDETHKSIYQTLNFHTRAAITTHNSSERKKDAKNQPSSHRPSMKKKEINPPILQPA